MEKFTSINEIMEKYFPNSAIKNKQGKNDMDFQKQENQLLNNFDCEIKKILNQKKAQNCT